MSAMHWAMLVVFSGCSFPRPPDIDETAMDAASGPDAADAPKDADGGLSDVMDGPVDAPVTQARCDPTKPFGSPSLMENINSSLDEQGFSVTRDEKTAFVARVVNTSSGRQQTMLLTQRTSTSTSFSLPRGELTAAINNVTGEESNPATGADGLTLYFQRAVGTDISTFVATRTSYAAEFTSGTLVEADSINPTNGTFSATISADGQTLYWGDVSFSTVWSATRFNNSVFSNKRIVANNHQQAPVIVSANELTMFYAEGGNDVMVASRPSKDDMFGPGMEVLNVNSAAMEFPVAITFDGCVLYISSNRSGGLGGYDIWEAHRPL